jgi:hypothetical protein
MALTREEILARRVGQEPVDLGEGAVVIVRGMTRGEAARLPRIIDEHDGDPDNAIHQEAAVMSIALVEPAMTYPQAIEYLDSAPHMEVERIMSAVNRLSGRAPGQAKGYTKSVSRKRRS